MRRKDREQSREYGLAVIDQTEYGVLSLVDTAGEVYSLPLSFARRGDTLYLHGAAMGRRAELFAEPIHVRIVFVTDVKVPPMDVDWEGLSEEERKLYERKASSVFTTEFSSAIVEGTLVRCEGEEKIDGLRVLCERLTPDRMALFDAAIRQSLRITEVYRVDIDTLTAKAKRVPPHTEWK